ncbi:hypothetical protein TIFTF001_032121 [Ficus carica]|uniref:Uncharacterized protein n=1 Tax=Ficus carica TaxID=3494 RepID=A0AA88DW53_FICCA|nr:hypothetical protein TIFTF001_032121 [Ficus carica]
MGSKHGAEPCFRKPSWKLSTSTTVLKYRPRRSLKTVVETKGFHDGLQRPSWKHEASTTVLQDRRGSAILPRQSSKAVVEARGFHDGFHLTVVESVIPRTFFINRRRKFVIYFPFTDCCP